MDPPKQIHENSMPWRIFNFINYMMGAVLFLAGSILFFPSLTSIPIIDTISIWFFIIGSFNFVLADGMASLHFIRLGIKYIEISLNFGVSMLSIGSYLVGSIFLLPSINGLQAGVILFLAGSYFLCLSEAWKLWRLLRKKGKPIRQCIQQHKIIFIMDILFSIGAITFLIGSYTFYYEPGHGVRLVAATAILFTVGSAAFVAGICFVFVLYFGEHPPRRIPLIAPEEQEEVSRDISGETPSKDLTILSEISSTNDCSINPILSRTLPQKTKEVRSHTEGGILSFNLQSEKKSGN